VIRPCRRRCCSSSTITAAPARFHSSSYRNSG
jgi:hypothetical protein